MACRIFILGFQSTDERLHSIDEELLEFFSLFRHFAFENLAFLLEVQLKISLFKDRLDIFNKQVDIKRLGYIVMGAVLHAINDSIRFDNSGSHYHCRIGESLFYLGQQYTPGSTRHHNIQDNQVGRFIAKVFHSFISIAVFSKHYFMLLNNRHSNGECSAFVYLALYAYLAAVFHDYAVADTQTKPRAFTDFLGCKERIENPGHNLFLDTTPVIAERDIDMVIHPLRGDGNSARAVGFLDSPPPG